MKSILIKDTTKEERERIVADALGCGSDCSMCCACGGMEIDYQQYIDGKKEIAQLNAEYRANTMIGHQKSDYAQKIVVLNTESFLKLERGFSKVISDSGLSVCRDRFLYQKKFLP